VAGGGGAVVAGALGIGFVAPLDDALESGLLQARIDRSPMAVTRTNGFMGGTYACGDRNLPRGRGWRASNLSGRLV